MKGNESALALGSPRGVLSPHPVARCLSGAGDLLADSGWAEEQIDDLAFLAGHFGHFHAANSGDVGILVPADAAEEIKRVYTSSSDWIHFECLPDLAALRRDGRSGYRADGVTLEEFFSLTPAVAGRLLIITRTGCQLPQLANLVRRGHAGRLLTVVEIHEHGDRLRIVYGNREHGSIPSIETHIHVAAAAMNVRDGLIDGASVHAHPPRLTKLGRHRLIRGDEQRFNVALFTQVEGMLPNYRDLVAMIPYHRSGSEGLLRASMAAMPDHRALLWLNHGFFIRDSNVRQCYMLMDYAESAADAAIDGLDNEALGLPPEHLRSFLSRTGLSKTYTSLNEDMGRSREAR